MKRFVSKELKYGASNYASKKVCISRGKGVFLYDTLGRKYLDFISAYSAVNQGHCHPRLLRIMNEQASQLTLTSRALHNKILGQYMEKITSTFKYDMVLPMNTGVEGGETAIKISRAWGYKKKGVPPNKAVNLFCENNFWGRTLAACSSSTDPSCYTNFGPYMKGFDIIPYNCITSFEKKIKENPNIVSIMLEPIQGEAGIIIPYNNYLKNIQKICKENNVLMIVDEVQTGLGRTGKMLASDYEKIKPDILILGKALSGGMMPVSAVLADTHIMEVLTPGTHGSTFGGNPLASAVAMEAIQIIEDEDLVNNSFKMGNIFRSLLNNLDFPFITDVRGKGLLNAVEFINSEVTEKASLSLQKHGILAKSTRDNILRFSPPLVINEREIYLSMDLIERSFREI